VLYIFYSISIKTGVELTKEESVYFVTSRNLICLSEKDILNVITQKHTLIWTSIFMRKLGRLENKHKAPPADRVRRGPWLFTAFGINKSQTFCPTTSPECFSFLAEAPGQKNGITLICWFTSIFEVLFALCWISYVSWYLYAIFYLTFAQNVIQNYKKYCYWSRLLDVGGFFPPRLISAQCLCLEANCAQFTWGTFFLTSDGN